LQEAAGLGVVGAGAQEDMAAVILFLAGKVRNKKATHLHKVNAAFTATPSVT
jgi:hypothetical protein